MKRAIAAVVLLLALAGCGDEEEPVVAQVTLPPPTTGAPPATTAPPASPAPFAGPTAGKTTPQAAAQAFYEAWGALDRAAASGFATQAAIDEAFALTRAQADFVDCIPEAELFFCGYYYEGGALTMTVVDTIGYGYIVTDVEYLAD